MSDDQKQARIEASRSICVRFEKNIDFLGLVVIMDECWVHFYGQEKKPQLMDWRYSDSLRPKK